MAFIQFPMLFVEDDFEKKENLGLKADHVEGIMTINTQTICAYNEMDNENVLVRMANGDAYEIPISMETFEDILFETEVLIDLTKTITEN